jgi:hypothetical protein
MVEQRPFKPLVSGSSPDALRDIIPIWGDRIAANILGFKLREGGSIPSPPAAPVLSDVKIWENGAVVAL